MRRSTRITGRLAGDQWRADQPPAAPPGRVEPPPINPVELEDRYLTGLDFPAGKEAVLQQARRNNAPDRVLQVLDRLEAEEFGDLPGLVVAVGDLTWDAD